MSAMKKLSSRSGEEYLWGCGPREASKRKMRALTAIIP
jgi:hypothetical protein